MSQSKARVAGYLGSPEETLKRRFDGPAANRLGDYELSRELGRGGMGQVSFVGTGQKLNGRIMVNPI